MSREPGADRGPSIAAIVPVLNEAGRIEAQLQALMRAGFAEIAVVDGGSSDETIRRFRAFADNAARDSRTGCRLVLLESRRGRALQMNCGARAVTADVLLFVHADSSLPVGAVEMIRDAIRRGYEWGRFDVRLDGSDIVLRVIGHAMNLRSALTAIATGDQSLFVRRDAFATLRGFAAIPLMEDIDLSRRLRMLGPPARIRMPVVSSARRWRRGGIARTVLLMWSLRFLYWLGVAPERLARFYSNVR